ncbi:hypothetical protein F5Y03DRAFT_160857 [Xylaria venustula]|nr:hypothetical protein F5Y03DRAFT_160857 [Xylaria venustula]
MSAPINQSVEHPVMPADVRNLLTMLDNGDSMNKVYDALVKSSLIECVDDKKWFTDHTETMNQLLHAISRPLLRCVLRKTLGPDLYSRHVYSQKNWESTFDIDGPGSNAMFSFFQDRKGYWLCAREIKELISILEDYVGAIGISNDIQGNDAYGASQLNDSQKGRLIQAMKIDDALKPTKLYDNLTEEDFGKFKPRFAGEANTAGDILKMVAMLRRRCLPGVDEETWQLQSPLIVGREGRDTHKLWDLMMSCIQGVMGLDCEFEVVCLFRAWKDEDQVKAAEVLGTVIAGSMVSDAGLNVEQPGTGKQEEDTCATPFACRRCRSRNTARDFLNSKDYVFTGKPWFKDNLELSIRQSPANEAATRRLAEKKKILKEKNELIEKEMKENDRLQEEYKKAVHEYADLKVKIEAGMEEQKKVLKVLEEKVARFEGYDLTGLRR